MPQQATGIGEDTGFVRRILQQDAAAFETLYDAFAPIVFGQLLQITGDRQIAEALLVETFFQAWSRAPAFAENRAALPRWLLGIARDLASGEESRCVPELSVAAVA